MIDKNMNGHFAEERGNPSGRSLVGHAPGMPGYSSAHDHERIVSEHAGDWKNPDIYFEAVKMSLALDAIAHRASSRAWQMTTVLRELRLAETEQRRERAISSLTQMVRNLESEDDPELRTQLTIDAIAETIEEAN